MSTPPELFTTVMREAKWLKDNPQFEERPASMPEFLGERYLNIERHVRPAVREVLIDLFGEETNPKRIALYERGIFTGAIGIGKTTVASIVLPYMAHWVLCLKDPQGFFDLMPGSRIAFMQMSTSGPQAKEVVFGDIKARIENSPWFQAKYPYDKNFKNQIRFEKDIWILPGDSAETTFEGYNILGGILDEIDSHKVTKVKDYAEQGYCVDEETEIFTEVGWRRYDQIEVGQRVMTLNHETGLSEWNVIEEVCVFPAQKRDLVLMEGHEFSALTTGNHRWPTTTRKQGRRWRTTDTLTSEDMLVLNAPRADLPVEVKYSDALVEALAWFWTEGHIHKSRQGNVTIYQKPGIYADRIRACLTALFGPAVSTLRGAGVAWRENLNRHLLEFHLSVAASSILLDHAPDRVVDLDFLDSLTQSQLDLFIQVSMWADNCGENKLAQKDHAAADAFAHACILAGRGVSYRTIPDRRDYGYEMRLIRILKKNCVNPKMAERSNGNFVIESREHDGIIWCPRTQNQTWLARRNGSVYFTGNTTIHGRITSRFQDRGFILLVGQMKKATGFAAKMYKDMKSDRHAYTCRMKIWESLGWGKFMKPDGTRDSFWYDTNRYTETTKAYAELMGYPESIIEVPSVYKRDFMNSPMKALRDLCGLPPAVSAPFIHDVGKVDDARQRWMDRYKLRVGPVDEHGKFADWFVAPDGLKRHLHIDVAYSGDGDALGLAMGHVAEMVQIEDEMRPFIVIDFVMRIKAPPGKELFLPDIRKIVYELRDQRRFRLVSVTTDGFESTEMRQQLQRKRFFTDKLSVDKTMLPYQDYYDALMDGRIAIPPYLTKFHWNDTDLTDIVRKESSELSEEGNKIDHPPDGSKDVTDCIAAVVNKLTGIRTYRTISRMMGDPDTGMGGEPQPRVSSSPAWFQHPAVDLNSRPTAPVPSIFGDPVPFAPPRRNK